VYIRRRRYNIIIIIISYVVSRTRAKITTASIANVELYYVSTDVHGAKLIDFRRLLQRQQHNVQQFPRVRDNIADGHELDRVRWREVRQQIRVRGAGLRAAVHIVRVRGNFLQLLRKRQTLVSTLHVYRSSHDLLTLS